MKKVWFSLILSVFWLTYAWGEDSTEEELKPHEQEKQSWYFHAPTAPDTEEAKKGVRNRLFPLWKSAAMGQILPKSFGLNLVAHWQNQDYDIDNVKLITDQIGTVELPISGMGADVTTRTYGFRGDLWLLPFLNIYGTFGYANVETKLKFGDFPIGNLPGNDMPMPITPLPPPNTILGDEASTLDFDGQYYAGGFVLAGGYKRLFLSQEATWAKSDLSSDQVTVSNKKYETFIFTPRLGFSIGTAQIWMGARYMKNSETYRVAMGEFTYEVDIDQADWNYLMGTRLMIKEHWEAVVEGGMGNRNSVTFNFGYRF